MSKKSLVVSKCNDLARAGNNFTVIETKLIEYCLSTIYKDDTPTEGTLFKVDVEALGRHFGIPSGNAYKELKQASLNIRSKTISFPLEVGKPAICSTSWIVSVIYDETIGELTLRFSPDLLNYVSGEKIKRNFTSYVLQEIADFRGIYSNILYSFCKSYAYRQANFEVFITLEEFRDLLCLQESEYQLWGNLNKTVTRTIKEINEKTSLTINMYVKKTRKQVTGLLFKMKYKEKEKDNATVI